jgi:hypothetical protein
MWKKPAAPVIAMSNGLRIGDTVSVTRTRPRWSGQQTARGRVEMITDCLYVVRLKQGWCECFRFDDPSVYMKRAI